MACFHNHTTNDIILSNSYTCRKGEIPEVRTYKHTIRLNKEKEKQKQN